MDIRDIKKILMNSYQNTNLSDQIVFSLVGRSGMGKTAVVQDFAKEINAEYVYLNLSCADETDLKGNPFIHQNEDGTKTTKFAKPAWMNFGPEKPVVVFLDEFTRASKQVLQGLLQLTNERRIETTKLPDNYFLICASNDWLVTDEIEDLSESYNLSEPDTAMLKRIVCLSLDELNVEAWRQWMFEWRGENLSDEDECMIDFFTQEKPTQLKKLSPRVVVNLFFKARGSLDLGDEKQRELFTLILTDQYNGVSMGLINDYFDYRAKGMSMSPDLLFKDNKKFWKLYKKAEKEAGFVDVLNRLTMDFTEYCVHVYKPTWKDIGHWCKFVTKVGTENEELCKHMLQSFLGDQAESATESKFMPFLMGSSKNKKAEKAGIPKLRELIVEYNKRKKQLATKVSA